MIALAREENDMDYLLYLVLGLAVFAVLIGVLVAVASSERS